MPDETHHKYLNFSAKERLGVITLIVLIIMLWLGKFLYQKYTLSRESPVQYTNEIAHLKSYKRDSANIGNYSNRSEDDGRQYLNAYNNSQYNSKPGELFYFNPNTLDAAGWIRLGVREKTAHTIQNYLAKGGKFRKPDDIKKIWGLSPEMANRLMPFVQIPEEDLSRIDAQNYQQRSYEQTTKPSEKKVIQSVDINLADTSALIALPGIGAGYAKRIVKFREALGGFVSTGQIAETYGLPDSTFQQIKPYLKIAASPVRKLNINTATAKELKHPYISYQIANAIVAYRNQHGRFGSVADVKKVLIVTEEVYQKVLPYLSVD